MKPLPPEVSLGQLLDILHGKKPKPVRRELRKKPLNRWWMLSSPVRHFSMRDPAAFEREWRDFLAATPRDTRKFLAMMAEIERKRKIMALIEAKRAKGRAKYLKRFGADGAVREQQSKADHIQSVETVLEDEGGFSVVLPNKLRSDGKLP